MNTKGGNIIKVDALTKKFGSLVAVNQVSFNVHEGEVFGFLGPNGAGKTTTIRMLTGLLTPDSGNVFVNGLSVRKNLITTKMNMGVIPEFGNIYVDLTARQNIMLAGRFYGISKRNLEKTADALLERFGLYERKDSVVKTFSKGMKQLVNIASALVHDPAILFFDEPTSGLDVQSQRMIRNVIKEMNQKGTTIFFTTHNIEEANILCERVGVINKGEIAAVDTPERLKSTFKEVQSVEVSFHNPVDVRLFSAKGLVSRQEKMGDKWKLYTDDPDKLIKFLVKRAQEKHLLIVSLKICGASLEEAFVKLIEDKSGAHA
jgi:ABC-2 type transport system ATP-binding protein